MPKNASRPRQGPAEGKESPLDDDAGQSDEQLKEKLKDLYQAVLDEPIPKHLVDIMRKYRKDKDPQ